MKKKLFFLILLLCFTSVVFNNMGEGSIKTNTTRIEKLRDERIQEWWNYIHKNPNFAPGKDISIAKNEIEKICRDKAYRISSGTDDYNLYYLIDDFVQIVIFVKRDNKIFDYPIIEKRTYWLKDHTGFLIAEFTEEDMKFSK